MFLALATSHARSLRSLVRDGLLVSVLALVLARPTPSLAQNTTVEIYDARDLTVLFTAPPAGQSVATGPAEAAGQSPFWTRRPAATDAVAMSKLERLVSSVASSAGAASVELLPGVYSVTADRDTHQVIRGMLTQLRQMSTQRYELELVVYPVATASAPGLGSAVTLDPAAAPARVRTTVLRRLAQPIEAVTRIAYISDWQPVVADNAVGNDPTTAEVVSGLACVAVIGAGPDSPESATLQITGRLTRAAVEPAPLGSGKALTNTGPASEGLGIGLPRIDERAINVDMVLGLAAPTAPAGGTAPAPGTLTAVAVFPGFEEGESLVLAAAVRELK